MRRTDNYSARAARGFTLAEIIVAIFIIFLLMGIALVSYRAAANQARIASDRALVSGLKLAIDEFKREFGIVPPLVKDAGNDGSGFPLVSVEGVVIPNVFSPVVAADIARLRGETDVISGFSTLSLAYYLVGSLDALVDGVDGPGFVEVRRAGNFAPVVNPKEIDAGDGRTLELARRGPKKYEPFFDTNRGGVELYVDTVNRMMPSSGNVLSRTRLIYRTEIRDRNGVPIRYYRWYADDLDPATIPGGLSAYTDDHVDFDSSVTGLVAYLNVPKVVLYGFGDPLDAAFEVPPEVRDATYAIVAAGPNRLFGDKTEEEELGVAGSVVQRQYAEYLGLSITRLQSDNEYRQKALAEARADNIIEVGS